MVLYDPKQHETLLVAWHYSLQADPEEHGQLFMEPLRNLTNLLGWAKDQVKLLISWDAKGLTAAAWVEPMMTGAFFGTWLRKDYRDIRGLAFIRQAHDKALEHFEPLIAVTKRWELDGILLRLGYRYVGEIPGLFDGNRVKVYYMVKETRDERRNRRHDAVHANPADSALAGEVRAHRHGGLAVGGTADVDRSQTKQGEKLVRKHIPRTPETRRKAPKRNVHARSNNGVSEARPH